MHKEMPLSLLTFPTLHTPGLLFIIPLSGTWETAFIFCWFFANKRKTIPRNRSVSTPLLSLFAPIFFSSLLPLSASQLPLPPGCCHCFIRVLFPPSQCLSPSLPSFQNVFVLSLAFNKGCPTRGHGSFCGHRDSARLEKLNIEFTFQTLKSVKEGFIYQFCKIQGILTISDLSLHSFNWIIFLSCFLNILDPCSVLPLSAISPSLLCKI